MSGQGLLVLHDLAGEDETEVFYRRRGELGRDGLLELGEGGMGSFMGSIRH